MLGSSSFGIEQKPLYRCQESAIDMHRLLLIVLVLVFVSALALVYLKYQNQQSCIQYDKLRIEGRQLMQESVQATIENSALSNPRNVRKYARNNGMHIPSTKEIIIAT